MHVFREFCGFSVNVPIMFTGIKFGIGAINAQIINRAGNEAYQHLVGIG